MTRKIIVLGATSAMAQQAARCFAAEGDRFFLAGRDAAKLEAVKQDLLVRGAAQVETAAADLSDTARHAALLEAADRALEQADHALLAYGVLPDQSECESSFAAAAAALNTNFISAASLLTLLAERFAGRPGALIAAISSVAGERGRKSNYVYGSAKGALTIFLGGLRNRLAEKGVTVTTILPGFVSTPMTAHLKQGPLFIEAEAAGRVIYRAMAQRREVVYVPWFWRWIMAVIRGIPEFIFKRMSL